MKHFFRSVIAFLLIAVLLVTSASALTVDEALELLDRTFVYEIPEEARKADTLDELFTLLGDPYTGYLTAEEYHAFLNGMAGVQPLVGIGVSIRFTGEGILILDTVTGGSAQMAGLMPGDLIVEIEGVSCVPANESHQALIVGEEGTFVNITVLRNGVSFHYSLLRRQVVVPNVEFTVADGNIGLIECTSFGPEAGKEVGEGITLFDRQADFWLLDLRSNGGGYTDAAIELLGAFGGRGPYLYLRDRNGYTQYFGHNDPALTEDPVIVLVNGGSASASEAVAAGIRDTGRGIVIGTRTYGKGVAQIVLDRDTDPQLFDGDALKVTAYRFYSQGANTTDMIGVIPTLMIHDAAAPAVAQALCGTFRDDLVTEGQMMLLIADQYFFMDMESLTPDVAAPLLSALPPSAQLWVGANEFMWEEITPADAAELLGVPYDDPCFTDVAASPYADAINTLGTYSLLLGDGTGRFLPKGNLTRAQVCAMLAQLLGVTYDGPSRFSDVADSAWYADEVGAMAQLGFVEGVGNGKFNPDAILTQQEYFTILGRMARFLNFAVDDFTNSLYTADGVSLLPLMPELNGFADWAKENVAVLNGSAETLGRSGTMLFDTPENLSPTAPISREQAALCLYRVLNFTGILPV